MVLIPVKCAQSMKAPVKQVVRTRMVHPVQCFLCCLHGGKEKNSYDGNAYAASTEGKRKTAMMAAGLGVPTRPWRPRDLGGRAQAVEALSDPGNMGSPTV